MNNATTTKGACFVCQRPVTVAASGYVMRHGYIGSTGLGASQRGQACPGSGMAPLADTATETAVAHRHAWKGATVQPVDGGMSEISEACSCGARRVSVGTFARVAGVRMRHTITTTESDGRVSVRKAFL